MARSLKPGRNLSRLARFAKNHLGVIMGDDMETAQIYRSDEIDRLDQYYEGTAYDDSITVVKGGRRIAELD